MAMARLYHFPTFHFLSSHKQPSFCSSNFSLPNSNINHLYKCRCSTIVVSSIKKSTRGRGKVKSDEDLYNDIRDFLSTAGLPENHVPTMKELSHYGRQDLANLVRRRGYKFIRQLLTTSSKSNIAESNIDTGQTGNLDVLGDSGGQNEKQKVSVKVSSNGSIQVEDLHSCIEPDDEFESNNQSYVATESNTLSLQEKVAKFIQHGELDTIEGTGLEITNDERFGEHVRNIESEDYHEPGFAFSHNQQKEVMISSIDDEISNRSVPSSSVQRQIEDPRKSSILTKEQTSIDGGKDLNAEVVYSELKAENQTETRRLKFLLHQKELELTQLKEQIEKEKLALSLLQTKAEAEISKAQKLISEKETELDAAEESLCGLKEVEINYSGDGETVELAGSFNGWDHNIKMDLQPSSTVTEPNPTGSRTYGLWRAVLWLYPGVYEIKFIIDGHWRVDPLRESISWNGVQNNVLRVE